MDEKNTAISTAPQEAATVSHTEEHHHHHHHHSHHSHHSKRRRQRKKESKFKRFVRHNRKKILYIAIIIIGIVLLLLLALSLDKHVPEEDTAVMPQTGTVKQTESTLHLEIPLFTKDVSLTSPAVTAYMGVDASIPASEVFEKYRGDEGTVRLDVGRPVSLSYAVTGIPDGYSIKKADVLVSENSDFTGAKVYTLKDTETSVNVYHLKTDTQYYYRIDLTLSNGTVTSAQGGFKTADTPRILSVEGVSYVRDIGGWDTVDGNRIKQGLLYRGTELDGAVNAEYTITSQGVNTMLAELGIRTDMDLRYPSDNKAGTDALGAGVEHIYYSAQMYTGIFEEEGKAAMRAVFSDLADESHYPVYLHCTHGLDRTGTVCYVLEALLGMPEEDLTREYQLSALHHGALWTMGDFSDFVTRFKALEGDTMQAKAENYLLSIGVTQEEINAIRMILLEK